MSLLDGALIGLGLIAAGAGIGGLVGQNTTNGASATSVIGASVGAGVSVVSGAVRKYASADKASGNGLVLAGTVFIGLVTIGTIISNLSGNQSTAEKAISTDTGDVQVVAGDAAAALALLARKKAPQS